MNNKNIPEKILALYSWNSGWHSKRTIRMFVDCAEGSISPAFSKLRREGYEVTAKWIWQKKHFVYKIK